MEKRFEIFGGETIHNRKPDWPDTLYVIMPRWYMWLLVHKLLNALESDSEIIGLTWSGEFSDMRDEVQS